MLFRPEILLQVAEVQILTPRIAAYRLTPPLGESLPDWRAGAHISVRLPSGRSRCYSLCGDPACKREYWIAVQREDQGQGGSREIAHTFARGVTVRANPPANGFRLAEHASHHLLIAAGIGVTPIISMIHELRRAGASYRAHICTRSLDETPFRNLLLDEVSVGRAVLHHSAAGPARRANMADLVGPPATGVHVYACGPKTFLEAFRQATAAWPHERAHTESFAPADKTVVGDQSFEVEIASSGEIIGIPSDKTLLAVLATQGHRIATSCRQGICGSCMVRYLGGTPDHRDEALSEDERREYLTACCSRAHSKRLVLDL